MKKEICAVAILLCLATSSLWAENPEVFFSPDRENEKVVVDFINGAQDELLIEAYSLTNEVIAAAIKKAKRSGVKVYLICDKANFKKKNDFCKSLGGKMDLKSGLMHNKVMIRDRTCVLTGSFNFTNNAVRNNRENFLIFCEIETVEKYREEFLNLMENNT